MSSGSAIQRVAIIGASGHVGSHFVEQLLKIGKEVTALTRLDSQAKMPAGVKVAQVDYSDEQSLITALEDQQFLVITLGVRAPPDLHSKIVKSATKAGVSYIMPNVYGYDYADPAVCSDGAFATDTLSKVTEVQTQGSSYVAMVCGFWYEWSLAAGEPWYGFDLKNRKVTFYDKGDTPICTSTWQQCGRALATLLSLPEKDASPAFSDWNNKFLYIDSFRLTQREMLDSVHRVKGTSDKDWEITYQSSEQRVLDGNEELKNGDFTGFAKSMYARVFTPTRIYDYVTKRDLDNARLGLPKEDLDEATKRAIDMVESGWTPFGS